MATEIRKKIKTVRVTKALIASAEYTAGDVLSEASTNTHGTDWTFDAIAKTNGMGGTILTAMVLSESEAIVPALTLLLFKSVPTCELDDNSANNAPYHADLAKFVGTIDFPVMTYLGDDSYAIATPSTESNLPLTFECATDDDALYGVLVTKTTFTQTAGDDMTIILVPEQY